MEKLFHFEIFRGFLNLHLFWDLDALWAGMYLLCHSIQNDVNPSSSFGFVKVAGIEVNFQSKILAEMP